MGKPIGKSDEKVLHAMYGRIDILLRERGLTWSDLATLIGVSQSTIATKKSKNANIGVLSLIKIAEALDVSLDEICKTDGKCPEYFDLCWAIPRLLPDRAIQTRACKKMEDLLVKASQNPVTTLKEIEEPELERISKTKAETDARLNLGNMDKQLKKEKKQESEA